MQSQNQFIKELSGLCGYAKLYYEINDKYHCILIDKNEIDDYPTFVGEVTQEEYYIAKNNLEDYK